MDCAKATEIPGTAISPLFHLLTKLAGAAPGREARAKDAACPFCGLRYSAFRESGMLGCPACYDNFAEPLAGLLKRFHGSARHGGKVPAQALRGGLQEEDASKLKERLKAAIAKEDFEEAARLRDRLRALQGT